MIYTTVIKLLVFREITKSSVNTFIDVIFAIKRKGMFAQYVKTLWKYSHSRSNKHLDALYAENYIIEGVSLKANADVNRKIEINDNYVI